MTTSGFDGSADFPPTVCPACGGAFSARELLRIERVDDGERMKIAGEWQSPTRLTYQRCGRCGSLVAVDARRAPSALEGAYDDLPDEYWGALSAKPAFAERLAGEIARYAPSGDLWDVGCGDGALLKELRGRWTLHGIEPGQRAAHAAQRRGLDVRVGTATTLNLSGVADVVLAVDVAEHLLQPELELRSMIRMLKPNGVLLWLTGDASALTSRIAGPNWYYLHCLGHVTVFSASALVGLMRAHGLREVVEKRFAHAGQTPPLRWARRLAGNLARKALRKRPAAVHYFRDHVLVAARAPAVG
jgi:SAM-dependent methyltransferase